MSLIVEDGTLASASANTYISLSFASSFCTAMGYDVQWATCSTAEQESAILRSMAYIESFDFKGVKVEGPDSDTVQPLKWPRSGAYDEDGYAFDDDQIPTNLKKAVAYGAYLESQTVGIFAVTQENNIKREKVDVIEIEYFSPSASKKQYSMLLNYLKGLLKENAAGFANVLRV